MLAVLWMCRLQGSAFFTKVNNLILALGLSVSTLLVGSEEGDGATSALLLVVGAGGGRVTSASMVFAPSAPCSGLSLSVLS